MGTIAKATLALEAQHAVFSRGMHQAGHDVQHLAHESHSASQTIRHAFEALAVIEAAHFLKEIASRAMESTEQAYRLSASLGITTGSLQELQTVGLLEAGMHAEEFNGVLQKLAKNLGEAAAGSGPAVDALKRLGLSGKDLSGGGIDDAFKKIAVRIGEVKDPTERAIDATDLFGKKGQALGTVFMGGAEKIEEAAAKARKFGAALSDVDAAKVMEANDQFEEVGLMVTGLENQLAVALAPILTDVMERVLAIIPAADKLTSSFGTGLRYVSVGVGYLLDGYRYLKIGVLTMAESGFDSFHLLTIGLEAAATGVVWLHNKLFDDQWGVPRWITDLTDQTAAMRDSIANDIKDAWDQPSAVSRVNAFYDGILKKHEDVAKKMAEHKNDFGGKIAEGFGEARKKIDDILKGMEADVANFGLTAAEKKVNELRTLNAKPADIAKAQGFANELAAMEDYNKRLEEANKLTEDSLTPVQKYQEGLEKIQDLYDSGMLDAQTYWAQVGKLNKDLGDSLKDPGGGKRAAAETRRFEFAGPTDTTKVADPMIELKNTSKQQLDAQKRMQNFLADIQRYQMNADNRASQNPTIDF